MLTLIQAKVKKDSSRNYHSLYRCFCGNEKIIADFHVRLGHTSSCGCLARQLSIERGRIQGLKNKTHGMTRTREHNSWCMMKSRCDNPNNNRYFIYGGRGIIYCEAWTSFQNFYADMGIRPLGTSLDRIDVNGNYEPSNCKWSTAKEQANNRRKSVKT